jgi:uncharacterized integral membrane protein
MLFLYVLSGILGAAAVIFTMQNPDPVSITFLHWRSVSLPESLVIMLAVFLGIMVASVSAFTQEIQFRRRISGLKIQIGELRRQVAELSDVTRYPRGVPSARPEAAPSDPQRVPMTAERGHRA